MMEDQLKFWLVPPIMMGIVLCTFASKAGIDWSWVYLMQGALLCSLGLAGFFIGPDWLWFFAAWSAFIILVIIPKLLMLRCDRASGLLNQESLRKTSRFIPYFLWGKLGYFSRDIYRAMSEYIGGDTAYAESILQIWEKEKPPIFVTQRIETAKLQAYVILARWQDLIDQLEQKRAHNQSVSVNLAVQAGRAYAETADFEKASQCLLAAKIPEQLLAATTSAACLLPYFCLIGDAPHTKKLLSLLEGDNKAFPDYFRTYWLARCQAAQGRSTDAKKSFEQALQMVHNASVQGYANYDNWKLRIERQTPRLEEKNQAQQLDAHSTQVQSVWEIFEGAFFLSEILQSRQFPVSVIATVSAMCAVYILSGCIDVVSNPMVLANLKSGWGLQLQNLCTQSGEFFYYTFMLDRHQFLNGQYWRLVTYLFLHGNLTHLLLNALGLAWFGRIAVQIYGNWKFLLIFFLSGMIGGCAQLLFSNMSAVGASAGVLGVFSAVALGIFKLGDALPSTIRSRELRWMTSLGIGQIILDRIIPQIAVYAHLGGLLSGIALGFLLPVRKKH
jgi:membrane associated rhomboid family serine protease